MQMVFSEQLREQNAKCVVIIPARLQSTRMPQKLLRAETGKPLIQHVYEAASKATLVSQVIVAADHRDIVQAVQKFGGNAVLTDPTWRTGTDRIAEVAKKLVDADIVINVQGDEPEIKPAYIDKTINLLLDNPFFGISTLATPAKVFNKLYDPNCVKVVLTKNNQALYFSRSILPYPLMLMTDQFTELPPTSPIYYQHVGIYAYRRECLLELTNLPRCSLEVAESLEQLRALYNGYHITVGIIDEPTIGIDTEDDYTEFVKRYHQHEIH